MGEIEKILDTTVPGLSCADLEYVSEESLIVIPTYMGNKIVAYALEE